MLNLVRPDREGEKERRRYRPDHQKSVSRMWQAFQCVLDFGGCNDDRLAGLAVDHVLDEEVGVAFSAVMARPGGEVARALGCPRPPADAAQGGPNS